MGVEVGVGEVSWLGVVQLRLLALQHALPSQPRGRLLRSAASDGIMVAHSTGVADPGLQGEVIGAGAERVAEAGVAAGEAEAVDPNAQGSRRARCSRVGHIVGVAGGRRARAQRMRLMARVASHGACAIFVKHSVRESRARAAAPPCPAVDRTSQSIGCRVVPAKPSNHGQAAPHYARAAAA